MKRPALIPSTVGLALLLSLTPGCGRRSSPPRAEEGLPRLEDVNVVLIIVDTLAAEDVGCLAPGEDPGCTPRLDALAAGGVLFRRAQAAAPWTEPSIASLLTGLMPADHGVTGILGVLAPEHVTLAEALKARGFATGGVVSNLMLGAKYGFDQGFDDYDQSPVADAHAVTSQDVTDRALEFLDRSAGERFFLLAHYFDPHGPWVHHPEFDRTSWYRGDLTPETPIRELRDRLPDLTGDDLRYLVGLYREEIAYTDAQVGRLLDGLASRGLNGSTLVVMAADHGEEFGRHDWIGHTVHLYDDLLHVPLIFSLPGRLAPHAVDAPVSLLDVMPTLLALSAAPPDPLAGPGVSLVPALLGGPAPPDRELRAEVSFTALKDWPSHVRAAYKSSLLVGNDKVIHDLASDVWERYDLAADPLEAHDLAPTAGVPENVKRGMTAWEAGREPFRKLERGRRPRENVPRPR